MKNIITNERGFALITAIMMLFAATILGIMMMNSSETEILLSGAQQRYENNLNVTEGGMSIEVAAVGTGATITRGGQTRSYVVVDPGNPAILSPQDPAQAIFDPGNDTTVVAFDENNPNTWPMDNLIQADSDEADFFDYQYLTRYEYASAPPKGYDATKFSGYQFQLSARRTTRIDIGGTKVGPKANL
jgi:hypothetical protein